MNEGPPTCKKVYFNRKYIFQPLIFRDKLLGFPMFSREKNLGDFPMSGVPRLAGNHMPWPQQGHQKLGSNVAGFAPRRPWYINLGGGPKIGRNTPKMDGEDHGKIPPINMDEWMIWGVFGGTPIFGNRKHVLFLEHWLKFPKTSNKQR